MSDGTDAGEHTIAPEVIQEASSQGWVPKDRFRGNEADWVDADVFVKRGREILPILRKNNENLLRDLNQTKEQLKEFRETAEEFKRFQKEAYERKAAEFERQIEDLKRERAQAITDGDGQKVNALDDALDEAKENAKEAKLSAKEAAKAPEAAPSSTSNTVDPQLQTWLDSNTWFGQDRRLTSIANGLGESLRVEFPDLKGKAFLDKLDEALVEMLPEKFKEKSRRGGSPVESGSNRQSRAGGGNAKSYENLPADAKAACDRYVKQKLMSREEYVASYDWS